ncbi:MAG: LysR family transcriptional regulator [Rhodobacteraceae bacterium PARR1]|nr:MAG: LysR family transcriptional regulator [Rhodobacteraceae bacterium PARR1]
MTASLSAPATASNADLAATLLRVTSGVWFVIHALIKIFVFTLPGTVGFFASLGLPGFLAYIVIIAELVGGIALIVGFQTRIMSLALSLILLGSIYTPHFSAGFLFSNANGGWEFPAFWALTLWALALLGDGAYAVTKR